MQAHYVVLDNPLPEHIYDALIVRIPVEKRMQISKFHSRTEKEVRLLAELLVRIRACAQLGVKNSALYSEIGQYGKPFFPAFASVFQYSISHTQGAALAAFHHQPVGADIEFYRTVHPAVIRRYFSVREQAYVETDGKDPDLSRILEIWTGKEAFAKCLGTGLPRVFSEADTLREDFPYTLHRKVDGKYVMTICASESGECRFIRRSVAEITQEALRLSAC